MAYLLLAHFSLSALVHIVVVRFFIVCTAPSSSFPSTVSQLFPSSTLRHARSEEKSNHIFEQSGLKARICGPYQKPHIRVRLPFS
ncbi:hypothetical protein BDR03DRAFT_1014374 [Suillus americanus]|nr:hypothetical protein BDR03DRAFT_1014374 [Suillus americanus]